MRARASNTGSILRIAVAARSEDAGGLYGRVVRFFERKTADSGK